MLKEKKKRIRNYPRMILDIPSAFVHISKSVSSIALEKASDDLRGANRQEKGKVDLSAHDILVNFKHMISAKRNFAH